MSAEVSTVQTVLILDTETTGLDPATSRVIELGCALWSVEHCCILGCYSSLIAADDNPVETINRIPSAALKRAKPMFAVMSDLTMYESGADAIVAHNAKFDRAFVGGATTKPWICSMEDLEWPRSTTSQSLAAIALAHDVGIVTAHRALADCLILARLFERVAELGVDVRSMLERGLLPRATYQALVDYKDREVTKAHKFRWNAETKQWTRRMLAEDTCKLPFPVKEIGP